ncbi:unnamed protein product [Cyprideis torosa]|uniref:EB domain-containing protein n=1 Tax=Cyprideis torosa TaxID=163714 RepID=A0A7R8ZNE4_9CRUS|nr:unnamed protein product [Cyprideis torosa]CAG0896100.1 unnamed protein product [Cyprideis torosa]
MRKKRQSYSLWDLLRATVRFTIFVVCALQVGSVTIKMDHERQAAKLVDDKYELVVDLGNPEFKEVDQEADSLPLVSVKLESERIHKAFNSFSGHMATTIAKSIGQVHAICKEEEICTAIGKESHSTKIRDVDIRVSLEEGTYPYVVGPGGCGDPGHYIYLPYTLFDDDDKDHGATWKLFGGKSSADYDFAGRLMFSLWLMYRYGIPPDYGCYGHELSPQVVEAYSLDADGKRVQSPNDATFLFNGCTDTEPYKGKRVYDLKDCELELDADHALHNILPVRDCRITTLNPEPKGETYTTIPHRSTTMPWLGSSDTDKDKRMCNKDTHKHHYYTPLSFICPWRGQKDIMDEHPDFKKGTRQSSPGDIVWRADKRTDFLFHDPDYVYISSFKNDIERKGEDHYAVLTYRATLSPGMVLLGANVEATFGNTKVDLLDNGCSPDPYPSDGYYSGLLPLQGKQNSLSLIISVASGNRAAAMPNALSRPGPMVVNENPKGSGHTGCISKKFQNPLVDVMMKDNGNEPQMFALNGYCIFFSQSLKNLSVFEGRPEHDYSKFGVAEFFELEHKWCKSKMPDSRILIFRSAEEVASVNEFLGKNVVYWVGGQRRKFCGWSHVAYRNQPRAEAKRPTDAEQLECKKMVEVYSGVPGKPAKTSFRWARQYDDQPEDPFPFTDRQPPWHHDEPNLYGPENHMTVGSAARYRQFNDLSYYSSNGALRMPCRFKGKHNLFFATRSMQACNVDMLSGNCPENITSLKKNGKGNKENRIYACTNKHSSIQSKISVDVNGAIFKSRPFVKQPLPLAGKIVRLTMSKNDITENADGTSHTATIKLSFKAAQPGKHELACASNIKELFAGGAEPLEGGTFDAGSKSEEQIKLEEVSLKSGTMVCSARHVGGGEKGHWSNIVTLQLEGYCDRISIYGDKNLFLSSEKGLLKDGDEVTISCIKPSMKFDCSKQDSCPKDCPKELKVTCQNKDGKTTYLGYVDDKESLPSCTERSQGRECTDECDCENIPTRPPTDEKIVKCENGKCEPIDDEEWIVHNDSGIIIRNRCPSPPTLDSADEIKADKEAKHGGIAKYTCTDPKTWGSGNSDDLEATCVFTKDPTPPGLEWVLNNEETLGKLSDQICSEKPPSAYGQSCRVGADAACALYMFCDEDEKTTCQCVPMFEPKELSSNQTICRLTVCTWSNVKDDANGRYSKPAPLKVGDNLTFTCDPGWRSKLYGKSFDVTCVRRHDRDVFPILVPPIYNDPCELMNIDDGCQSKDECPRGADCDNGNCKCPNGTKFEDSRCICEDKQCGDCKGKPSFTDGSIEFNDKDLKASCPQGQHPKGETFKEIDFICFQNTWEPKTNTASFPNDWMCEKIKHGSSCSPKDDICDDSANLVCDPNTGTCICKPGFTKDGDGCKEGGKCAKPIEPPTFTTLSPSDIGESESGASIACKDENNILPHFGFNELDYWCSVGEWSFPTEKIFNRTEDKCHAKPTEPGHSCADFGHNANNMCNINVPLTECKAEKGKKEKVCTCIEGTKEEDKKGLKSCEPFRCKPQPPKELTTVLIPGEMDKLGIANAPGTTIKVSCPKGQVFEGSKAIRELELSCLKGDPGANSTWNDTFLFGDDENAAFPICISSTDCRADPDQPCPDDTMYCDPTTWQCTCNSTYDMDEVYKYCRPKECEFFEELKATCKEPAKLSGVNKRGEQITCACPEGTTVKGLPYTTQTYECFHSRAERKNFWKKGGKIMRNETDVRFQPCVEKMPPGASEMCEQVYRNRYGEVDEHGYPHRYSSLAYLTLGWSSGMTLVSVSSWAAVVWLIWKSGLL